MAPAPGKGQDASKPCFSMQFMESSHRAPSGSYWRHEACWSRPRLVTLLAEPDVQQQYQQKGTRGNLEPIAVCSSLC